MKMCSISVAPIPSRIGLLTLRVHSSNMGAGKVSPAETAIRSEDKSAPSFAAASITRYAVGAVKQIVDLWVWISFTSFGGEAFSRKPAAAPNLKGNIANPPSSKVKARGGDPT